MGEYRELQKMKNSGNEAKKYMKTKHITFLNGANYARLARNLAQLGHQYTHSNQGGFVSLHALVILALLLLLFGVIAHGLETYSKAARKYFGRTEQSTSPLCCSIIGLGTELPERMIRVRPGFVEVAERRDVRLGPVLPYKSIDISDGAAEPKVFGTLSHGLTIILADMHHGQSRFSVPCFTLRKNEHESAPESNFSISISGGSAGGLSPILNTAFPESKLGASFPSLHGIQTMRRQGIQLVFDWDKVRAVNLQSSAFPIDEHPLDVQR